MQVVAHSFKPSRHSFIVCNFLCSSLSHQVHQTFYFICQSYNFALIIDGDRFHKNKQKDKHLSVYYDHGEAK